MKNKSDNPFGLPERDSTFSESSKEANKGTESQPTEMDAASYVFNYTFAVSLIVFGFLVVLPFCFLLWGYPDRKMEILKKGLPVVIPAILAMGFGAFSLRKPNFNKRKKL